MGSRGTLASSKIAGSLVGLVVVACTSIVGLPDLPDIPAKGSSLAGGAAGLDASGAGGSSSGKGGNAGTKAGGAPNGGTAGSASGAEGGTTGQSSMGGSTMGGTVGESGAAGDVANAGADASGGTAGTGGTSGGTGGAGGSGGSNGGTSGSGGSSGTGGTGGTGGSEVMQCEAAASMPNDCPVGPILRFASFPYPATKVYSAPSLELAFDATTGLKWQRSVAKRDDGTCMGPVRLTLGEAICYCNSLSLPDATSGWRLPSRAELLSILDFTKTPMVDPNTFDDTPNGVFWTSSLLGSDVSSGAFHIAFNSGGVTRNGDPNDANFVRCVKDGWNATSTHYTAGTGSLANTVYDNWTDIRWLKAPTGPGSSADLANSCDSVTIGGRTWRVPSVLELLSLVDETASGASFDTTFFDDSTPDTFGGREFCSSTTFSNSVECVDFTGGQTGLIPPSSTDVWTRCVADD
ncbi:MAG TPA: DUF1566 domain-containing protein [Polyangiaceae bacterium]|nr:DUF1566 domain-containing protein [Polyangiaceae bacterium]